jgi:hypothetical protein
MARDLLNRSNEFVGIDQRLWVTLETGGYGALATSGLFPTGADAIEHTMGKIEFDIPRDDAAHRSGRSRVVRLSHKRTAKFSFESYIVPGIPDGSGHPTPPDAHPMLLSAMGSVDLSDPTKIVYGLTRSSTSSFRFLEEGTHFSRLVTGCVADNLTFTLPGDGKAMMKVDGFGQNVLSAGEATASAIGTAVNAVTVTPTGAGQRYEVGSYIDIIDKTDGNTRHGSSRLITGIAGDTLTFSGAPVTFAMGDIVIGAAPDFSGATSSENALLGLRGSFSTGAFGVIDNELLSAEIMLKNNYTQKTFIYGTDTSQGFIADKRRDLTLKLEVLLTKDNFDFYQKNKNFIADSVEIDLAPQQIPSPINSPVGRTFKFKFAKVEFKIPAIEQPADGYIKLTLEGIALASSINSPNDEFSLEIS